MGSFFRLLLKKQWGGWTNISMRHFRYIHSKYLLVMSSSVNFPARAEPSSHFLYRFLEGKKTTRSQFSVPGLREIHRNLKQEKKFDSRESFFRKSPFCTFSCINPGFGRPWDMLRKIFLIPIFIMLQKNAFGQKKFWISCTGSKVPFWQKWKIAKMALLNPCMKFKNFFGQKHSFEALWKWG